MVLGLVCMLGSAVAVEAKDVASKEPGPKAKGKLYQWTSKNGITCHFRIPKGYDPDKGAPVTYILHGSNLDHRWGFANHNWKSFRPDDIVISPDGTTSNGRGGFNSLGRREDAKRFHAFTEEIEERLNVTATYLYGHSQGSFFAFYYAGEYPQDVQGVVGHASGVWTQTRLGTKGHHQPIVLMHGTQDPVVPYVQSAGGYSSFVDAKYPHVRLRSLEWWNHWPAEHNGPVPHTSQQLAWVEGMSTNDPERLDACWAVLGKVKNSDQHDYVATWSLAGRLAELEGVTPKTAKQAAEAKAKVEALVQAHIEAIAMPKDMKGATPEQLAHFIYFMRRFDGIPACDSYVEGFGKTLTKHQKKAIAALKKYFPAMRQGDVAEAFDQGITALEDGPLWPECHDRTFRENLATWRKDARKHDLGKRSVKAYDEVAAPFDKALTTEWKAFCKLTKKAGKL